MKKNIKDIISEFRFEGDMNSYKPYGSGHINDTFRLDYGENDYILQRINTNVFTRPVELMENVVNVTNFLREKITEMGGDPARETLTVVLTKDGGNLYIDKDDNAWRAYHFVKGTKSYDLIEDPQQFYASGVAFGNFQKLLADFPIDTLNYTIDNFHHTPSRFETFMNALEADVVGRAKTCQKEIDMIIAEKEFVKTLWDLHEKGELALKVTHNDTKLNNVLFDKASDEAICVIDLDTVMPGFALDDFGDSIRFGATTALEDEKDLNKVNFDIDLFETYVKGFLEGADGSLTDLEITLFPVGAKMLTIETAIRFLTDYLQGDTYFKTAYDDHNLVRSRTQLKLVSDMNDQWDEMSVIVDKHRP